LAGALVQVLREFNPQDDDEGKEFVNARVSVFFVLSIEERKGAAV